MLCVAVHPLGIGAGLKWFIVEVTLIFDIIT